MRTIRVFLACCLLLSAGACSMHVIEVQQGTIITPEMVAQLKPGMTRSQVRFVMGTPTISDPFHHDRWDYVYTSSSRTGEEERYRVVLFFEDDKLVEIDDRQGPGKGRDAG